MRILRLEKETADTYRIVIREGELRGISKRSFKTVAEGLTKLAAAELYRNLQRRYRKSKLYADEM